MVVGSRSSVVNFIMKHIPNLFTLLNLIFGCLAIVATLQNGIIIQYAADGTQLIDIPEKYGWRLCLSAWQRL